ncbi:MAG: hypothetical protein M1830_006987 [Pleopsidium flavum]|nr:MAG: hypothetical protein M1830_006987 [Pleopsidium flavum]
MAVENRHKPGYNTNVDLIREEEYPMLKDTTYLDHAGTTLYAKSLIERFSNDMLSNVFGNPHSASASSQLSMQRIEDIRLRVLSFFNANPEDFDIIFVANATAGMKLVMEAFRESASGYWYGYHKDSHTSLVGVRENARAGQRCFQSDTEVDLWLSGTGTALESSTERTLGLFAYPGQSNLSGRRLPLDWPGRLRSSKLAAHRPTYTLLDAAALVSTSPLNLSDSGNAPDFTTLSFYKIFGFPDLGALIVRKKSGHILQGRKYFGGGTVEMVSCSKEQWHIRKEGSLHEQLEDGTLPFHSIVALDGALDVHKRLYGSMEKISQHVMALTEEMCERLVSLRHGNGNGVCQIYDNSHLYSGNGLNQGPVVAFNLRNSQGAWVSNTEVEKLAAIKNFHLRTGGLCNPGGIASNLDLAPWQMKRNFSAGQRCGNENDVLEGKPTGVIRVSLGAMSNMQDVTAFLNFVQEFFVEKGSHPVDSLSFQSQRQDMFVESLTIYPIKSCGGWKIPPRTRWEVRREGMAWDREWCLVHQGTGAALSQKRYPRMALLRPEIDLVQGVLRVHCHNPTVHAENEELNIPLSADPSYFHSEHLNALKTQSSQVCGDTVEAQIYTSSKISEFCTRAIGVSCTLARFSMAENGSSQRHSKAHLQRHQATSQNLQKSGAFPVVPEKKNIKMPILLSNESPILTISRSSLNRLNEQIKETGGKAARAEVFRANIVVAEDAAFMPGHEQPYIEDTWRYLQIGQEYFQMLGSCRRCQMVCVDQDTAEKNEEPFVTLAKTRRFDGKVFFGQHTCHLAYAERLSPVSRVPSVKVGDPVRAFRDGDEAFDKRLQACLRSQTL